MTGTQDSSGSSKAMIVGFALVATGGLIGLTGMGISAAAIYHGIKSWMRGQEEPPSAIVKRKINQAKAATSAGASAWQDGMATSGRH